MSVRHFSVTAGELTLSAGKPTDTASAQQLWVSLAVSSIFTIPKRIMHLISQSRSGCPDCSDTVGLLCPVII